MLWALVDTGHACSSVHASERTPLLSNTSHLQPLPVPAVRRSDAPHVVLEYSLRRRGAFVRLVRTEPLCQLQTSDHQAPREGAGNSHANISQDTELGADMGALGEVPRSPLV